MTLTQYIALSSIILGMFLMVFFSFLERKRRKRLFRASRYSRQELKAATLRAMKVAVQKVNNKRTETIEQIHSEWFEHQFPNN